MYRWNDVSGYQSLEHPRREVVFSEALAKLEVLRECL